MAGAIIRVAHLPEEADHLEQTARRAAVHLWRMVTHGHGWPRTARAAAGLPPPPPPPWHRAAGGWTPGRRMLALPGLRLPRSMSRQSDLARCEMHSHANARSAGDGWGWPVEQGCGVPGVRRDCAVGAGWQGVGWGRGCERGEAWGTAIECLPFVVEVQDGGQPPTVTPIAHAL